MKKADVITLANEQVEILRDDYHEFTELALVYLSAAKGEDLVTFRKPVAPRKAMWIAKLIYSLKIALSESQIAELQPGTITNSFQSPKIRAFTTFVTHVYAA